MLYGDRSGPRILEIDPAILKLSRFSQAQGECERTLVSVLFSKTPYLPYSGGGQEGIKMASASTQSVNEPTRT